MQVSVSTHSLRESAFLVSALYTFKKNEYFNTVSLDSYKTQRAALCHRFCYSQESPRLRIQAAVPQQEPDRPLDIHASLMKKDSRSVYFQNVDFEGAKSKKYAVKGSYLYYHYGQDNFNDNVGGFLPFHFFV